MLLVNNSKSIDDMLKESSDLIGGCTIRESSVITVLNKPCVTGMLTSSGEVIHCFLKVNLVAQDLKLVSVEFELWKMLVNKKEISYDYEKVEIEATSSGRHCAHSSEQMNL